MTTNPSHILIARNSRNAHNPSASLSSPTETHAAAAGIFRSFPAGPGPHPNPNGNNSSTLGPASPPWHLENIDTDDVVSSDLSTDEGQDPIAIDAAFTRSADFPGTVKIVVEATTFWAHRDILYFASPFFQAALSGDWAETTGGGCASSSRGRGGGRPQSVESVITISQPPSVPGENGMARLAETEMTFGPIEGQADDASEAEAEPDADDERSENEDAPNSRAEGDEGEGGEKAGDEGAQKKEAARLESLDKLQGQQPPKPPLPPRPNALGLRRVARKTAASSPPSAVIVLKEEKASTFHDFLRFVYPGMECTISWNNVEGLMNISHKLCVPALTRICLNFLLTHAAGRPIKAMRIAELFEEEELYREGSRFVLDNPGGWPEVEMSTLSAETLLKLEKRRTWFLERVLKLGLVQIAKEYECCATCPDSSICARLVEDKWRQAYQAVFRFGPCQPSMVFRYLRSLEGVSPPLALTHLACQMTAKAFVATLFDRMFSLGVRGSGTDTAPLGARVAAVAGVASATLPRRHFLYCSLRPENPAPARGARYREAS